MHTMCYNLIKIKETKQYHGERKGCKMSLSYILKESYHSEHNVIHNVEGKKMLRTNSKKARANVLQYLRDNSEYIRECAEYDNITIESDADICKYIWNDFIRVKKHEFRRSRVSYQDHFSDYASGLPLGVFDYHYHCEAVNILGDILEETEEERAKYTESDAERVLDYLIFREVQKYA